MQKCIKSLYNIIPHGLCNKAKKKDYKILKHVKK